MTHIYVVFGKKSFYISQDIKSVENVELYIVFK